MAKAMWEMVGEALPLLVFGGLIALGMWFGDGYRE